MNIKLYTVYFEYFQKSLPPIHHELVHLLADFWNFKKNIYHQFKFLKYNILSMLVNKDSTFLPFYLFSYS